MGKISDELSNSRDKEIARSRWCGCSTCVIGVDAARYLLAMLVEKERRNEKEENV